VFGLLKHRAPAYGLVPAQVHRVDCRKTSANGQARNEARSVNVEFPSGLFEIPVGAALVRVGSGSGSYWHAGNPGREPQGRVRCGFLYAGPAPWRINGSDLEVFENRRALFSPLSMDFSDPDRE